MGEETNELEVPQASLNALHAAIGRATLTSMGIATSGESGPVRAEDLIRAIAEPMIAAELRRLARSRVFRDSTPLYARAEELHPEEFER